MRKTFILTLTSLLLLTGCGVQAKKTTQSTKSTKQATITNVKPTTEKIIQGATQTWTFGKRVGSQQTTKGVSEQLTISPTTRSDAQTNWTTGQGQISGNTAPYDQISFKTWSRQTRQSVTKEGQDDLHFMSVTQINQTLKKLGANFKIGSLNDLIYLETKTKTMVLPEAIIAKDDHLYIINIEYITPEHTQPIDRGQVLDSITTQQKTTQVPLTQLNGTWTAAGTTASANDSGKVLVKDGYLYQQRYDSYERSAIQSLASESATTLSKNAMFTDQQSSAAKAGYQLTGKSVASGDSIGYLYLFVNNQKLVRIGEGLATDYQKTSDQVSEKELPQQSITIFKQMDAKYPGKVASTITTKADAPIVGMSDSINYLTDVTAGQITENKSVTN